MSHLVVSGRCVPCAISWTWDANRMKLRDAFCPNCGRKLSKTTHATAFAQRYILRPADEEHAVQIQLRLRMDSK
jgi:hypothetical protein